MISSWSNKKYWIHINLIQQIVSVSKSLISNWMFFSLVRKFRNNSIPYPTPTPIPKINVNLKIIYFIYIFIFCVKVFNSMNWYYKVISVSESRVSNSTFLLAKKLRNNSIYSLIPTQISMSTSASSKNLLINFHRVLHIKFTLHIKFKSKNLLIKNNKFYAWIYISYKKYINHMNSIL